jgi:hypothetical protein
MIRSDDVTIQRLTDQTEGIYTHLDQSQRLFQQYWDILKENSCLMLKLFMILIRGTLISRSGDHSGYKKHSSNI